MENFIAIYMLGTVVGMIAYGVAHKTFRLGAFINGLFVSILVGCIFFGCFFLIALLMRKILT